MEHQETLKPAEPSTPPAPQPEAAPQPVAAPQPKYTKADVPALRSRVNELRRSLGALHQQKEQAFGKRKQLDSQISAIAGALKQAKTKRDTLTAEVRERKLVRTAASRDIQQRMGEVRKLSEERNQLLAKHKVRGNPEALRAEINALEYRIETAGLPFSKEQELMKVIKEKKKLLAQFAEVGKVLARVKEIDAELSNLRARAEGAHREVQEKASASQHEHEVLVKDAQQLRQLRAERKALSEECTKLKAQFASGNAEFTVLLAALQELGAAIEEDRRKQHAEHAQQQKLSLAERSKLIEAKLKGGGKLTTADLLVLQSQE